MQKIVTITINTIQLSADSTSPFVITEADEINSILQQGWQIEEWDFLKEGEEDGQVILMVIMNDDLMFEDNSNDDFDTEFDEQDDDGFEDEEIRK